MWLILFLLFLLWFMIRHHTIIVKVKHKVVLVDIIGRFSRTLSEGINFTFPWERERYVTWNYPNQEFKQTSLTIYQLPDFGQQIDIAPVECATSDEVIVSIDFLIVYKVDNYEKAVFSNSSELNCPDPNLANTPPFDEEDLSSENCLAKLSKFSPCCNF